MRTSRHSRAGFVVATLAVGIIAAGCSGSSTPAATPVPASATSSVTPAASSALTGRMIPYGRLAFVVPDGMVATTSAAGQQWEGPAAGTDSDAALARITLPGVAPAGATVTPLPGGTATTVRIPGAEAATLTTAPGASGLYVDAELEVVTGGTVHWFLLRVPAGAPGAAWLASFVAGVTVTL